MPLALKVTTQPLTIGNPSEPPTVKSQAIQFALIASTIFVWRGVWKSWTLGAGAGVGSAFGSLFVGGVFIILFRWCTQTSELSPPYGGKSAQDRTARVIFNIVVIACVSLYWRGWWSIADNVLGRYLPPIADCCVTLFIGIMGLAALNCTELGKQTILDYTALEKG
mmetsp:Transcript_74016/g.149132  ORF Transcript_74016/g.149132 Transcript_74016/m.149132 type:complete len:166 (+) Transcript_74016:117-614(+)